MDNFSTLYKLQLNLFSSRSHFKCLTMFNNVKKGLCYRTGRLNNVLKITKRIEQ